MLFVLHSQESFREKCLLDITTILPATQATTRGENFHVCFDVQPNENNGT